MLGVLANSFAVLLGGVIGMLCGSRIKSKYTDSLMVALGLATMGMGVASTVGTTDVLCIIVCCSLGAVLGELLHLDDGVNALGRMAERKFGSKDGKGGSFTSAFVSCSIMFCVGSMAVMGSVEAGLNGDNSILFAKAVLDLIASLAYGAAMGVGVAVSFACVLVVEGALTLLAGALAPLLTDAIVTEMSAVGGVLLIGLAINLLNLRQQPIKIANMLPAVFLPAAYVPLYNWITSLT